MYHLFIGYLGPGDDGDEVRVSVSRFLEYSDSESQMRYGKLDGEKIDELKKFPVLTMREGFEDGAFITTIKNITRTRGEYIVKFNRDIACTQVDSEDVKDLALSLDIDDFEFHRTHWAIKNIDLWKYVNPRLSSSSSSSMPVVQDEQLPENKPAVAGSDFNNNQVFIVHGHDQLAKNDIKKYVEDRDLEPIILHLQASGGRTIIEKIDHYSNVGFGIVIYSECDIGAKRDTLNFKWRARQNVVFEHGYLIAKLGRSRVAAVVKGSVETPNDISGVVYTSLDPAGSWKDELDEELRNSGYVVS